MTSGRGTDDDALPSLPGFREMAERRRRLVDDLAAARRTGGLTQTEVAARMRTSQSMVARIEAGEVDVRLSTLERYAAAVGRQLDWRIEGGDDATTTR
jgi:predicted transcriptional regulator